MTAMVLDAGQVGALGAVDHRARVLQRLAKLEDDDVPDPPCQTDYVDARFCQ